jgi:hypothetical protein
MPASARATRREIDPILDGIAMLTLAISSINIDIAMIGLSETVATADASQVDTSQGQAGFDTTIFRKLAAKDEPRVRVAAESLKDPFRRILSVASIDQWRAADLEERGRAALKKKEKTRNPK